MTKTLIGWTLTEGTKWHEPTQNPKVSEVVAALEGMRPEMKNPYMILEPPVAEDEDFPHYCQVLASEMGYVCEIRIFDGNDFTHSRAFLPDADGTLGDNDEPQLPNLSQAIGILTKFMADPGTLPTVNPVEWLDVSEEFGAVPA